MIRRVSKGAEIPSSRVEGQILKALDRHRTCFRARQVKAPFRLLKVDIHMRLADAPQISIKILEYESRSVSSEDYQCRWALQPPSDRVHLPALSSHGVQAAKEHIVSILRKLHEHEIPELPVHW